MIQNRERVCVYARACVCFCESVCMCVCHHTFFFANGLICCLFLFCCFPETYSNTHTPPHLHATHALDALQASFRFLLLHRHVSISITLSCLYQFTCLCPHTHPHVRSLWVLLHYMKSLCALTNITKLYVLCGESVVFRDNRIIKCPLSILSFLPASTVLIMEHVLCCYIL